MQQEVNQTTEPIEEELDLLAIFLKYMSYWKWFLLSILLFIGAGVLYLKTQPSVYQSSVKVLLKDENSAPEEMMLLQDLGVGGGKNNVDNEIEAFKSPDLSVKAITSLELYTEYRKTGKFWMGADELYQNAPVYIRWEDIEPESIPAPITFTFTPSGKGYTVLCEFRGSELTTKVDTLPTYLRLPMGRFYVSANKHADPKFTAEPYEFTATISNPMVMARKMSEQLEIKPSTKQSTVLTLSFNSETEAKGRDYLSMLVSYYNDDASSDKNMVSRNTSVFIEERIKDISVELGDVEHQVEQFREANKLTDIQAEAQLYLGQTGENEQKRLELETQLNLVRFVEDFIKRPENRSKLIPNLGVTDAGLVTVINEYNQLLLQKERLQSMSSESNPALIQLKNQITSLRSSINSSLANVRHANEIAIKELDRMYTVTHARLQSIPSVEREYKDIMRQQEVKNNLFVYLLQKREETALTQAAIAPKAKILTRPFTTDVPVAPKVPVILLAFFLVGLVVPVGCIFVRDLFHTRVENIDDLEPLKGIDVIGDIPIIKAKMETVLVVKANDDSPEVELFRTLRNNLLFMLDEPHKKVIMVTSTVPTEGKTFISINLARSLSLMDKKVLLIGGDIRNPQINNDLGIPKTSLGFTSVLAGHCTDYHDAINEMFPNFYIMQAGPIPPNPNELLSKKSLDELIARLRDEFDYIVIDSAPVGVVSDSFILSRVTNNTVYVMRQNVTQKDTVHFLNSIKRDARLNNIAVVLNGTIPENRYGSYKYGYKYSYRYGYSQKYGYKH